MKIRSVINLTYTIDVGKRGQFPLSNSLIEFIKHRKHVVCLNQAVVRVVSGGELTHQIECDC